MSLFLKGLLIGLALIIPGLSAGAIALITGVYTLIITALSSLSLKMFLDRKKFFSSFQIFLKLNPLFLGIAFGILLSIHQVLFFIEKYPVEAYSLFSGLILSGLLLLFREMKINVFSLFIFILSALSVYFISWIPREEIFSSYLFWIFPAVYLASLAMLFPGISGSYILMVMGVYEIVLSDVKSFSWKFIFYIFIAVFGVISTSRWVKYVLTNHHSKTLAVLSGMTLGGGLGIFPVKSLAENSFNSFLFLGLGAFFMVFFQNFFVREKK